MGEFQGLSPYLMIVNLVGILSLAVSICRSALLFYTKIWTIQGHPVRSFFPIMCPQSVLLKKLDTYQWYRASLLFQFFFYVLTDRQTKPTFNQLNKLLYFFLIHTWVLSSRYVAKILHFYHLKSSFVSNIFEEMYL